MTAKLVDCSNAANEKSFLRRSSTNRLKDDEKTLREENGIEWKHESFAFGFMKIYRTR